MDKSKKMLLSEDMDVQKMCKSCKYSLFQFWETMFVQQQQCPAAWFMLLHMFGKTNA